MIQKSDFNDRRILKFPAVHPCEGISPSILVGSLITLSRNICNHQSKFFATQRRNSRETIRQIRILSIFFEEILNHEALVLSNSIILCFAELHFTFQKIQFLLEDCTREGARLWILMNSEFVAAHFRLLIRAIATALEVLPLNSIDVSGEVKELIELVARQARKAKIELDREDRSETKRVVEILIQFEEGIAPETSLMKRVLDYLEIRSWNDCNKEIKFLEVEIGLESLHGSDEREVPFLSSLVGFMSYCRGVVFETLESGISGTTEQTDSRCNMVFNCLNFEDLLCPISLELMTDPVTVSTGQTYDRSSIQKWLQAGNTICPKTGKKLINTELLPNCSVQRLIQQFCIDNGVSLAKSVSSNRDISKTIDPGSPSAAQGMKLLAKYLANKLDWGTEEEKNKAAYEIRLLTKSSIFNRCWLIKVGTIPPLLNLLSSTNPLTQENAMSALLKLSKQSKGKKMIIQSGGLSLIITLLKKGSTLEARQIAAATLFYLSSVEECRILIGETQEAIPALVELIIDGTNCGKKNALVTIFGLLLHPGNRRRVFEAGIVPLLLNLLASSDRADLVTDSLAVLAALAESVEATFAILQASALPLIVRILNSSTSKDGKEYCVSILLSSCINGGTEVIGDLVKEHSLPPSLYSLLTDGTSHSGKKARLLLRILHKFQETSSGMVTSSLSQERFVRVW